MGCLRMSYCSELELEYTKELEDVLREAMDEDNRRFRRVYEVFDFAGLTCSQELAIQIIQLSYQLDDLEYVLDQILNCVHLGMNNICIGLASEESCDEVQSLYDVIDTYKIINDIMISIEFNIGKPATYIDPLYQYYKNQLTYVNQHANRKRMNLARRLC